MATRKARTAFAIKRFKGLVKEIGRSKRGTLGVSIIVFFVLLGVLAPVIAPYDPIAPWKDPGQYPAYDSPPGPKLAEKLCVPSWYKYVPWIHRGPIELKESFTSYVVVIEGQKFPNVTNVYLQQRIAQAQKIEVIFPNGSSRELVPVEEWMHDPADLRRVTLDWQTAENLPDSTRVEVTYSTGADITQTMELVTDYKFSSSEAFYSKWQYTTSDPELFNIEHNSQEGFESGGCIEIAYSGSEYNASGSEVNATVFEPFVYGAWTPPTSFATHLSARTEATTKTNVTVSLWLRNEALGKSFLLSTYPITNKPTYLHYKSVSAGNETTSNVGQYPERIIFPSPANMSFAVSVNFPNKENDATVYIDNVQCLLYGNSFGVLGTDNGSPFPPRDIFSTLVHGTRVSLIVGVLSALFSTVIGLFLGLISGYVGGVMDETVMRFADLLLVLPTLPLFIVLIAVMKSTYGLISMWNIILLLTFFGWMGFSRTVRSMVLSIRERPFIEAAKAAGGGKFYIITKHMIPNVFPLVYVTLATSVPGAIVTEASLSWLGLGDPSIPSWGKLLYDFNVSGIAVTKGLIDYWFWIFPPCVAIAVLATAFILLGFALDEILNPRLRQRR